MNLSTCVEVKIDTAILIYWPVICYSYQCLKIDLQRFWGIVSCLRLEGGKKKDNDETMWCHFSIAYFLSAWIVTVALIQMPVCQSIPEGIFQNNLHFIVFTRSKQYRHMENCASKSIPVLTRLPFFLGQVITSFSHALPLPASACQMCSVLRGPVLGTGHNPFRGPTRSPPCSPSELLQFHELACYMGICLQENK